MFQSIQPLFFFDAVTPQASFLQTKRVLDIRSPNVVVVMLL